MISYPANKKADGASDEKVAVALKLYAMMAQGNTFAMRFMDEEGVWTR